MFDLFNRNRLFNMFGNKIPPIVGEWSAIVFSDSNTITFSDNLEIGYR